MIQYIIASMNFYVRKPFGLAQGRPNLIWQKVLVGAGILVGLIIFLNLFESPVRNTFYFISSPISNVFFQAGKNINQFFGSFLTFGAYQKENSNLKQENKNLLSQIAGLQNQIKQNQDLKSFIQTPSQADFSILSAETIGLNSANDMITISRGSKDGIQEGMPVISPQKVVYGKVTKVYKNFSEVMLVSNVKSVVDVKILQTGLEKPQINGAVKGIGNLGAYLDLVNSDAKIQEHDVLITSGLEGIFPADLLVGKIESASQNDAKAFQTANVKPFFDINTLDNVFVITNYKKW